jgi:hypothetical protein
MAWYLFTAIGFSLSGGGRRTRTKIKGATIHETIQHRIHEIEKNTKQKQRKEYDKTYLEYETSDEWKILYSRPYSL